jgi:lysophospholipase L1-like esterase
MAKSKHNTSLAIAANSKLIMIGDSITDCERARPVGEGLFGALGKGYVSLVDGFLQAVYPQRRIRVVNMGTSGNTARDLAARWQTDVIDQKPEWVSVMIGINDVWRQFDTPWQHEWHVPLADYRRLLTGLVAETRPRLAGMVLMTPYIIDPNRQDPMRAMMEEYGAAVKELARKHDAVFVDTQAALDAVLAHLHPATLAWDRIHPNTIGHAAIARAFLRAVNFQFA